MSYKIAVVTTAGHGDSANAGLVTTRDNIQQILSSDERYKGSEVRKVAWNNNANEDWTQYTHILMSDDLVYVDYLEEFFQWMRQLPASARARIFNPYDVIQWNVNKSYLLEFREKGVRIAATAFVGKENQLPFGEVRRQLEEYRGGDLKKMVIKNIIDADGLSATCVSLEDVKTAELKYNQALQASKSGIIVQEFLPAIVSEGEWSAIFIDQKLSHGARKTTQQGEFRIQSRYGGSEKPIPKETIPHDVAAFADEVLAASPYRNQLLYARVDIVRSESGLPCLMEFEAFEPCLFMSTDDIKRRFVESLLSR